MSDVAEQKTPPAEPTKDAPPAETVKPFNLDLLQQCTARMTNQCWQIYLRMKGDLNAMQHNPLRATLITRTDKGMQDVAQLLAETGVNAKTLRDAHTLDFTATFAQIQTIIKHPQTLSIDVIKL